ncbi:MAG: hypothetical protein J7M18_04245 [Candidatus Eremiobacteraeota bacterium]|nr:hypothetical protein [Candidatus Eremiobacteraeota bacterium]
MKTMKEYGVPHCNDNPVPVYWIIILMKDNFSLFKGLLLTLAFISAFLSTMIGIIMLRFSRRPDIVPTGPMGMMEDPISYRMGIVLIFCAILFFLGIILQKKKFSNYSIAIAALVSMVPLVWGWFSATPIYLEKNIVILGSVSSLFALILALTGLALTRN